MPCFSFCLRYGSPRHAAGLGRSFRLGAGHGPVHCVLAIGGAARARPVAQGEVGVPGFWDPRRRPERPDTIAPERDPVHYRDGLSAVQFCRPGRQPAGLQRRARAPDLRGAQARLHGADAPLRDAASPSLDDNRGDAAIASIAMTPRMRTQGRLQRSVLPHACALRGAARFADR